MGPAAGGAAGSEGGPGGDTPGETASAPARFARGGRMPVVHTCRGMTLIKNIDPGVISF